MRIKLRKKKKYANKFRKVYGDEAIKVFEDILWETGSLSEVAKHFHFSRSYCSILFKKIFGMNMRDYQALRFTELEKTEPQKIRSYKTLFELDLLS